MATTRAPSPPLAPTTPPRRGPRRRRALRWAKRVLLGALAVALVGALVLAWMPRPVPVDVAPARIAPLEVHITEDGQTRVEARFVVAAPASGDLARVALQPGAEVEAGAELARIAPPSPLLLDARARREASARLALATARHKGAEVAIARATTARALAERDLARARTLAARGVVPAADLERTEAAAQLAAQDLAAAALERGAARAEVEAARAVLAEPGAAGAAIAVRAPAAGTVLRVLRDSAGPIAAGTPLLELGDLRALEIVVDVLSSDAARIAPGMPAVLERWGGDTALRAIVRRIEPAAFTRISALGVEEQRVRVIAALADPPPALGDGFRVTARIITWRGDAVLVVPASAVFRDRGAWAVYTVAHGRAHLTPVELGHRGLADVELRAGLAPGALVITHPGDHVRDGAAVAPR